MADYPPKKNAAYTLEIPIFDTSGNYLSGATITSSRISKDDAGDAPTTNSWTEIATNMGIYSLALTNTEMNADRIVGKVIATGARPVFFRIETATRQLTDLAFPAVSGRSLAVAAAGSVDATSIAAGGIAAASFAANAIDATALAQNAAQEIADEVLNRNIAGGGSGGARIVRDALRAIRNRRAIAAGTLTVYQEDDATPAWTGAVTTAAGNPVSQIDPA